MRYSAEEMKRLAEIYPTAQNRDEILDAFLGHSWTSIMTKASHLGLHVGYPNYSTGEHHYNFGQHRSEETKLKISQTRRERGIIPWMKGKHHSAESRAKASQSKKGWVPSDEWREKQRIINTGRVMSPEWRAKIGEAHRILLQDPEYRQWRIERSRSMLFHKPNKAELQLKALLDQIWPGDWEYVGDGKVIIEGFCPDFINCNGHKQIIELFGRKYHDPKVTYLDRIPYYQTEDGRKEIFAKYGYQTLIIWDNELKNEQGVISKIQENLVDVPA